MITPEVARKIKDIGVGYVGISLDGLREVNDKFRGKAGAFEAAMNGIKNCVAVDQRVGLRYTINHHNIQELENIFDFIEEENINRVCIYHLVYSGRGKQMMDEDDKDISKIQIANAPLVEGAVIAAVEASFNSDIFSIKKTVEDIIIKKVPL